MAKKSSEWYFGVQHDEILDQTLRARERAQRRLEASLGGRGKDQAALASAKAAKVPAARDDLGLEAAAEALASLRAGDSLSEKACTTRVLQGELSFSKCFTFNRIVEWR